MNDQPEADQSARLPERYRGCTAGPWASGGLFDPGSDRETQWIWGPRQPGCQSGPLIAKEVSPANARLIADAPQLAIRVQELEHKHHFWREKYDGMTREQLVGECISRAVCREAGIREVEEAEARVQELEVALRPFVEMIDELGQLADDCIKPSGEGDWGCSSCGEELSDPNGGHKPNCLQSKIVDVLALCAKAESILAKGVR